MSAKLAGVLAMFASILVLFVLPWLDRSPVRSARFRPVYKQFYWLLIIDCIILGICGAKPADAPWTYIAQAATAYYFLHFLVIIPLLSFFEKTRPLPTSISEPVLKGSGSSSIAASAKPMEKA